MRTVLLSIQILAAETTTAPTPTQLPADTAVIVAEADLVTVLGAVGTPAQVALLTANKPQENALEKVVGESLGYRYLRAGSASEVRGALREAGLTCGVFLAPKGSDSWRATRIGELRPADETVWRVSATAVPSRSTRTGPATVAMTSGRPRGRRPAWAPG